MGRPEQRARRAVIPEKGNFRRRIRFPIPLQDPQRLRTAPLVDGLEIVAGQQDIPAFEQLGKDRVFQLAGVLHLVDGDETEALPPAAGNGFVAKKRIGPLDQVAKIQPVKLSQRTVVFQDEIRALPFKEVGQFRIKLEIPNAKELHLVRPLHEKPGNSLPVILRLVSRIQIEGSAALLDNPDEILERRQRKAAHVQVPDDFQTIVLVKNREIRKQCGLAFRLLPDNLAAKAVNSPDHDAPSFGGERRFDALRHFLAGFVRKRQAKDLLRHGQPQLQDTRDTQGKRVGLPRPRGGEKQEIFVEGVHDLLLVRIQCGHGLFLFSNS